MSADQLRRAATRLRASVEPLATAMKGQWFVRADHVIADDGTDVGMLVVDPYQPDDDGPLMDHIALVASPPVVLALANWLDATAVVVEGNDACDGFDLDAVDGTYRGAVNAARAILREEPDA